MGRVNLWLAFVLAVVGLSCGRSPQEAKRSLPADRATNPRTFMVRGTVLQVDPAKKQVQIKHEEIPGYMPAMTMPFEVRNTNELKDLTVGERISFRMVVTSDDGWIEQLTRLDSGSNAAALPTISPPPTTGAFRMVRDVQPLEVGDLLPETRLINEFGSPITTSQFRGQALAITFIFTRCPFPTFCPFTARNFAEVQQKLSARQDAPKNWHLLTVSFDPDFDKPAVLKGYAQSFNYDSNHWSFATGTLMDITAIADALGCTFWHDESGSITHNLRTAVIDPSGRLYKIFAGNGWTSDELVAEVMAAATKK